MLAELTAGKAEIYPLLEHLGARLAEGLRKAAAAAGRTVLVNQLGSMITVFFTEAPAIASYDEAKTSDTAAFGIWFRKMLDQGIYWPPSQYEAAFLSAVMTEADIDRIIAAAEVAFKEK